jgi:hypothetical protein
MTIIRVRDIIARQRAQEQPVDNRAQRLAENAKRHLAEQADADSWMNQQKITEYLANQHDCSPVEAQDVLDLLATATHFRREDFENGSAITVALATIRGEL